MFVFELVIYISNVCVLNHETSHMKKVPRVLSPIFISIP